MTVHNELSFASGLFKFQLRTLASLQASRGRCCWSLYIQPFNSD